MVNGSSPSTCEGGYIVALTDSSGSIPEHAAGVTQIVKICENGYVERHSVTPNKAEPGVDLINIIKKEYSGAKKVIAGKKYSAASGINVTEASGQNLSDIVKKYSKQKPLERKLEAPAESIEYPDELAEGEVEVVSDKSGKKYYVRVYKSGEKLGEGEEVVTDSKTGKKYIKMTESTKSKYQKSKASSKVSNNSKKSNAKDKNGKSTAKSNSNKSKSGKSK